METIITICGWVLFGLIAIAMTAFVAAFVYGCTFLGYHLSTRLIRERRWWKKAIRESNHRIVRCAAVTMSDRFGYGEKATLGDIIRDTTNKINNREKLKPCKNPTA